MPELGSLILPPDTLSNTGDSTTQESTGTDQHIRALAMPFLKGQMVTEPDGSLLIKDVPMLAEGIWTDSAQGTPLDYIPKTLENYAGNWLDDSGWSRHLGGVPRDATEKVAQAVNPHYGQFTGKDGKIHNAVLSDVKIHPFTQKSRDMQEMIRHGLISFVSVEHGGKERYNPTTRNMEAETLAFMGFAFVNKGACKLCRLNEQPKEKVPAVTPKEKENMETKELEEKITALTKELEAVKAQKPVEVIKTEIPKELSEQMTAMAARIKELESKPVPPVAAPIEQIKELGDVETVAVFNAKEGTIRGN